MQIPTLKYAAILALAASVTPRALAVNDSALIDILQRKGVLSEKEANSVREELAHSPGDSASKIKLNSAVSELKLYGDLRFRYQYDEKDTQLTNAQGGGSNVSQQSRWRFRLRLNADLRLGEHVFGGVEVQTAKVPDSGNQTYGNGFSDFDIFISRAYMGWHPNEWLTITGGKFANPFYTTELLWDSDINPTGVAEVIAFHHLIDDADGTGGTAKDGKTSKAMIATERPWTLSLVAGQFIFQDNNESNGPDGDSSTDAYLFQTQLIGSYKFGRTKVTLAPGWLTYINGSLNGIDNGTSYNDAFIGQGGTRALNLLLAPGDVSLKLAGVKTKFYWDFSYNFDGEKRVQGIYGLANKAGNPQHRTKDDFAWLAGVQIGENHMAGDWSLMANWRQTGLGAVDPNLNDSDYALGQLNTRGAKFVGSYNLTDFTVFSLTYDYAWNLRNTLFGGQTTGGSAVANSNVVNSLLVEFLLKF